MNAIKTASVALLAICAILAPAQSAVAASGSPGSSGAAAAREFDWGGPYTMIPKCTKDLRNTGKPVRTGCHYYERIGTWPAGYYYSVYTS